MTLPDRGPLQASLLLPKNQPTALVCLLTGEEETDPQLLSLTEEGVALLQVRGMAWNDLSPWPAPPVFGNEAFTGGAGTILSQLTDILRDAERQLLQEGMSLPPRRILCGYSLAGLFSLWCGFQTGLFTQVASISGSLWFDGFVDWAEAHMADFAPSRVYLSLGDKECRARNPRMAQVEAETRRFAGLLEARHIPVSLTMNPGGHFHQPQQRVLAGLRGLLSFSHDL